MKMNFLPIYQRELKSTFFSPIAYLVMGIFLLLSGYFWSSFVTMYANYSMRVLSQGRMGPAALKLNDYLLTPFLGNLTVTFLFLLPLVSMRSFSEEKKSGTIEMLFTYPFTDFDILLGKYLACLTLLAAMIVGVSLYPLTILGAAGLPWASLLLGEAGLFLVGASFLALGVFTSTLSENQVISAVLGFGGLLLLFLMDWAAQGGGPLAGFLTELSVMGHFKDSLAKGLLNLKDLSYYVFFIAFFLFATLRVLESKKWR